MKVIIAGSRQPYQDHPPIYYVGDAMAMARSRGIIPTEIVSGGARGVDLAGEMWAAENNLPIKRFIPDWSIGKQAGFLRNIEMAEYGDALVAIWDGRSRGTAHMIAQADARDLNIFVYYPEAIKQPT